MFRWPKLSVAKIALAMLGLWAVLGVISAHLDGTILDRAWLFIIGGVSAYIALNLWDHRLRG